jgi:acetylornithine/N-succinyldiaminopimelate aminotransferase
MPDIMTLAKALAGGLPMGAMLAAESVSETFQRGDHATTFGGGALISSAALASIEAMKRERLVERSAASLRSELKELHPREIRGLGLMIGLDLDVDCKTVVQKARDRGVLLNNTGDRTIRLVPPLVVTREQIDRVVTVIGESL